MHPSFFTRRLPRIILLILPAVIFALLGLDRFTGYTDRKIQERRNARLLAAIAAGDRISDPAAAVRHYLAIDPPLQEVRLRVLRRQWTLALHKMDRIRKARRHPVLSGQMPEFHEDLARHLSNMTARCDESLAGEAPPPPELSWRLYNLRGMAKVMEAFLLLSEEQNEAKAAVVLKDAAGSFKQAVAQVDRAGGPEHEKNIPRWNLELLHGEENLRKIRFSRLDAEGRLSARENLEAMIPEGGGYAAGEPSGARMRQ